MLIFCWLWKRKIIKYYVQFWLFKFVTEYQLKYLDDEDDDNINIRWINDHYIYYLISKLNHPVICNINDKIWQLFLFQNFLNKITNFDQYWIVFWFGCWLWLWCWRNLSTNAHGNPAKRPSSARTRQFGEINESRKTKPRTCRIYTIQ